MKELEFRIQKIESKNLEFKILVSEFGARKFGGDAEKLAGV
jgi:hypothetical protein